MKTELIRALDGLPLVHSIDAVTSKTFISGQIQDRDKISAKSPPPPSLLHRIGDSGILLCSDFSTIPAIKSDDRNAILADLLRIYDGELRKEFGTSDAVPVWKGRITLIAGVTPEIDKHYGVIQPPERGPESRTTASLGHSCQHCQRPLTGRKQRFCSDRCRMRARRQTGHLELLDTIASAIEELRAEFGEDGELFKESGRSRPESHGRCESQTSDLAAGEKAKKCSERY